MRRRAERLLLRADARAWTADPDVRAADRRGTIAPLMPSLRRAFAIVALVLVVAPLVANAPLFDPDEGLHAAIAQEMARGGDYVTPRFLGEPFLDKPILFFWAEALSLRVFGMHEAAVRIPPLLFGLGGMIAVALLGRRLCGEATGLVAAPWYVAMERAHPGYLHYYFVERHLQGYLTATQRHAGRGWWYYVPIVVGGTLPWTGYLLAAARRPHAGSMRLLMWGWFVAGLVFLSAGESKLATYALPLFPALAILAANAIVSSEPAFDRVGYGVYAIALAAMPIGAIVALNVRFGHVDPRVWIVNGLISAAIVWVAVAIRRMPRVTPQFPAWPLALMAVGGLMVASPRAAEWMTAKETALELNRAGRLPPRIIVVDERVGSLVFYLDPALRAEASPDRIVQAGMADAIQRSRAEPLDAVVVVRNNRLERFERQFAVPPDPTWTAGTSTIFRVGSLRQALRGVR